MQITEKKLHLGLLAVCLSPFVANADILTENFDDPLGSFYTDWLGTNSNVGSYFRASTSFTCDEDYRGNADDGLFIADTQECDAGVGGSTIQISFDPEFASSLTALSFGVETPFEIKISAYDTSDTLLGSTLFSSDGDDLFEDIFNVTSGNGIGGFLFDSSVSDGFNIEGNVKVDNFEVNTATTTEPEPTPVPEPGTLALLGAGLVGMGFARRRKQAQ